MNIKLINFVISSWIEALRNTGLSEFKAGNITVGAPEKAGGACTMVIKGAANAVRIVMLVTLDESAAVGMASAAQMKEYKSVDQDVFDAIKDIGMKFNAEIKKKLAADQWISTFAPAVVSKPQDINMSELHSQEFIRIPLYCDAGKLLIQATSSAM